MGFFKKDEFTCKCGCGTNLIKESTLAMLEAARAKAGIPFVITSGTRCENHNYREGGKKDSAHLTGYAVDIKTLDGVARYKVVKALLDVGFNRIGIAKSFIHADNDPMKPQNVIWEY